MSKTGFPFSAVLGQDDFKLALILSAINPAIGGVVISGPRGCAKSTLARGLADLLPVSDDEGEKSADFVTLPLGASEEMLLGTLDLEHVLNEKTVRFSPGLLSKADGGVLYVDEVNLLPDNLVDLLLDVASSGVNRIERDGISHSHRSEFLLVGTMNPDEGELRPQLHDRFGLSVDLDNQYLPTERVEIVKRRELFEREREQFCEAYKAEQEQLLKHIESARVRLNSISCDDLLRLEIAERCSAAQVDGLRADIVWYRAAIANAAFHQRTAVTLQDIDDVEALVLAHRRKVEPTSSDKQPPSSSEQNKPPSSPQTQHRFKRPDDSHRERGEDGQKNSIESSGGEGDWGPMSAQMEQQKTADITLNVESVQASGTMARSSSKPNALTMSESSKRPDWYATLISSLPSWPPEKLRFKPKKQSDDILHLILLDTSASTLQAEGFAHAKAALLQISQQAYIAREKITLFGFGNSRVDRLLSKVRAPKELREWLDQLSAGGGTPMRAAFLEAQVYLQKLLRQNPQLQIRSYVLTDGRSSSSLEGVQLPGELVWIDTELSQIKRGKGPRFAQTLNATYLSLAGAY
ncbi:AAA family ATPase [Neptuniibacter sp. 1_MG-2023]|uniref:AAA family ATPase n=1 Tax=Neptuniibacter sp. 1_MG-2023 TaxID=3062662 RepID=UPI0026E234F2|nr:AAA family ATPase [Neptuniibacter sp. 1_MG-2023]MDO6593609.1 AAA family ATPase [Neptuniibacter sp. 1_MG-2023]